MLLELLKENSIKLNAAAESWQEAICQAGQVLVENGACTEEYVEAMVDAVREFGPYIVIEDGIAMPHAKSKPHSVRENGIALVTLKEPVDFGNPDFAPVRVLFAICSADPDTHLEFLQELSQVFECESIVETLTACESETAAVEIVKSALRS